jgi:hypothetical protein
LLPSLRRRRRRRRRKREEIRPWRQLGRPSWTAPSDRRLRTSGDPWRTGDSLLRWVPPIPSASFRFVLFSFAYILTFSRKILCRQFKSVAVGSYRWIFALSHSLAHTAFSLLFFLRFSV